MKKIISTIALLIFCCLPVSSFALKTCTIGNNDFCKCFYDNCATVVPGFFCTSTALKMEIAIKGGLGKVCHAQTDSGNEITDDGHVVTYQECTDSTNSYFNHC